MVIVRSGGKGGRSKWERSPHRIGASLVIVGRIASRWCTMRDGMRMVVGRWTVYIRSVVGGARTLTWGQFKCIAHLGTGRTGRTRAGDGSRVAHGMWEAAMHIPIVVGTRQWGWTNAPFSFGTVIIMFYG